MPARARLRLEPTDDWQQLHLLAQFPEQLTYELIRPVVLFGHSPAERAQQTGAAARDPLAAGGAIRQGRDGESLRANDRETSALACVGPRGDPRAQGRASRIAHS